MLPSMTLSSNPAPRPILSPVSSTTPDSASKSISISFQLDLTLTLTDRVYSQAGGVHGPPPELDINEHGVAQGGDLES